MSKVLPYWDRLKFFPYPMYHLTTGDTWIIKETGICRQVLLWGGSLFNQQFVDFPRSWVLHVVVFNNQKDGPIWHEFSKFVSNPFKYLWELPGNLLFFFYVHFSKIWSKNTIFVKQYIQLILHKKKMEIYCAFFYSG